MKKNPFLMLMQDTQKIFTIEKGTSTS